MSQKALEKQAVVTLKDPYATIKEDLEIMHICKIINSSNNATATKSLKNT
jgi:hypothetical protein